MPLRAARGWCLSCRMKPVVTLLACIILFNSLAFAAPKSHVVALEKWISIKWSQDDQSSLLDVKVRPLYVDTRIKEFTVRPAHEVTERTFVVQRMFRLNDSLPQDSGPTHWRWERGGWVLVDRVSGKVQPIMLPEFDPSLSSVNWFRDDTAYCGVSDNAQKAFAMIKQLGKRKPLLKKSLADAHKPCCALPPSGSARQCV
jgi:hypothetical protein